MGGKADRGEWSFAKALTSYNSAIKDGLDCLKEEKKYRRSRAEEALSTGGGNCTLRWNMVEMTYVRWKFEMGDWRVLVGRLNLRGCAL